MLPLLNCNIPPRPPASQVHKLLGKGSYGKVYKVQRDSDGQFYALKETELGGMSHVERMDAVNEIRLLVSIAHPSVVRGRTLASPPSISSVACTAMGRMGRDGAKAVLWVMSGMPRSAASPCTS